MLALRITLSEKDHEPRFVLSYLQISGFPEANDDQEIRDLLTKIYNGSSTAMVIFDQVDRFLEIKYLPLRAGADEGQFRVYFDFLVSQFNYIIDKNGFARFETNEDAITHEIIHAVIGATDPFCNKKQRQPISQR